MALVQYENSSSDSETDDSETVEVKQTLDSQPTAQKRALEKDKDQGIKKIKIAIPKIADYDTNEDDVSVIPRLQSKINNSNESSGLLNKLPPPKTAPTKKVTTTSFVPHTVTRKPKPTLLAANKAKALALKAKKESADGSASDDNDEEISSNFDEKMWTEICGRRTKAVSKENSMFKEAVLNINPADSTMTSTDNEESVVVTSIQLDNDAFKQLVGSSKRRIPSDVMITDIDESDMLQKTDVWMRKALTDPQYQQKPSSEDSESSNPVAKNKHHITFLAQQAKAKEQELQAQWASGNQKRQMSRAKYGF